MSSLVIVFTIYICIVLMLGIFSYFYTKNINDYILGGRSSNGFIVALGVCASDMSSWLLLALPGAVMFNGLNQIWLPIGLFLGAYLNWSFVARRLRVYTELSNNAITIPSYLEHRFMEKSGSLRLLSAIIILIFFTFYTSSAFVAGGILFSSIFKMDYTTGLYITVSIILIYTCIGGFLAISWIDLFQGVLMFIALIIVPLTVMTHIGSIHHILDVISQQSSEYIDIFQNINIVGMISMLSWGLGYFGQPHILIRFMSVINVRKISQAQNICMVWMCIALMGAIFTGFFGIAYFSLEVLENPESVFILLAERLFNSWFSGILLAAVLSATISVASAQLLVSSSVLIEDLYHKFIRTNVDKNTETLIVSRLTVIIVTIIAIFIASNSGHSILHLVSYAWAGLGASFGPVVLLSLFWKRMNIIGAFFGISVGALSVIIWPIFREFGGIFQMYELFPGFLFSCLAIYIGSALSKSPVAEVYSNYDKMLQKTRENF